MENATKTHRSIVENWMKDLAESGEACEDNYLGKRESTRIFEWTEHLEIRHNGKTVMARGHNLSEEGVGFFCKHEFTRRDTAEIRREDDDDSCWVPIAIQHSTQTVGTFKVGATFQYDSNS